MGVGRLDDDAAREALAKPLAEHDAAIDASALTAVVEHSQRYSYFIQLWGDALWQRRGTTGETPITMADVAAARPGVSARMADYYQSRYDELRNGGLLTAAMAVAPLFQDRLDATAREHELDAALAKAGIDDANARLFKLQALNRLGYVWDPPGQVPPIVWSAGIPSLMTFVLEAGSRLATHR